MRLFLAEMNKAQEIGFTTRPLNKALEQLPTVNTYSSKVCLVVSCPGWCQSMWKEFFEGGGTLLPHCPIPTLFFRLLNFYLMSSMYLENQNIVNVTTTLSLVNCNKILVLYCVM